MNTNEYLDAAKRCLRIESDYALAKALEIRASTISGYRAGRSHMDDEVSVKVAGALGIHPGLVMLDMHRERAKTPEIQHFWASISEKFSASFLNLLSGASPLVEPLYTR